MSDDVVNYNKSCSEANDKYFNITLKKRSYPSCYHYNILIMLTKRLINKESERVNSCMQKVNIQKHFNKNIINA